jgi:AraC-like DNA-binding protein
MTASDADARYTVAASGVSGLLAYARAAGIATDGALEAVGLSSAALQGPEARVTHRANNELWARLSAASGDPDFGLHFAERLDVGAFDVVGYLVARSRTFGEGLARVVAYSRILHDAGRVEVEREGAQLIVYPGCRGLPFPCPRPIAEFSAASVVVLARALTGAAVVPLAVEFEHPAPARVSEHRRIFGVLPRFQVPETRLVFSAAVLDLGIRGADPGLLTYLDAYASEVLARLPVATDLLDEVRRVIATELPRGVPEMAAVAAQLGVSSRTLQRRIATHGTTFAALVDQVRRSFAERYLADGRLALGEVAFLVGFADPSNFHRAFRRWTGTSPARYRAAQELAHAAT